MKTLLAVVAVLLGSVTVASGQTFPSRTLALVVPFPAGGPTDTIGRIMAQRMGTALGQTVVVENVTGAGGTIAGGRVAQRPTATRSASAIWARTSSPARPTSSSTTSTRTSSPWRWSPSTRS